MSLREGIAETYVWIDEQVQKLSNIRRIFDGYE
jgi:hypothetical protein